MLAEQIKARLSERIDGVKEVKEVVVNKNNGIEKKGFSIVYENSPFSPTVYMEDGEDEDRMIDRIVETIVREKENQPVFDMSVFEDKEKLLGCVIPVLVNAERNKDIGNQFVTDDFLDLKVVYKIDLVIGTTTITQPILDKVGATVEELRMSAMINAKNSFRKMSMASILGLPEEIFAGGPPMTIVTNDRKVFGAGVMINEDAMSVVGDKFFILPSSVHELICLPYSEDADIEMLKSMVAEVNGTEVDPMYFLSDSIYVYENGKVRVA